MKKLTAIILSLLLVLALAACNQPSPVPNIPSDDEAPAVKTRVLALKGPTGIGMAKLMDDAAKDSLMNLEFTVAAQPTEAVAAVSGGKVDIAAVPTNLAATLYKKTEKKVKMLGINTLGSLYILENGNTINTIADLKGKTVYATGQGANPEYILNYILEKNNLKVGTDVKIEFKAEHAELATLMAEGECVLGMLPEPNVSSALAKNPNLRIALNLDTEWRALGNANGLTMGCVIVRTEFLAEHPDKVADFITKLEASINYAVSDPIGTGALCEKHGIVPSANLASQAIPNCNLTFIDGADMKGAIESYFTVLHTANPASVGGAIPDEGFYYIP